MNSYLEETSMNMKKLVARALPMVCAACITVVIAGCGDDSSKSSSPTTPEVTDPTSSTSDVGSSDDAAAPVDNCVADPSSPNCSEVPPPSSTSVPDNGEGNPGDGGSTVTDPGSDVPPITATFAAAKTLSVTPDTNGFYDVGDIYKAAPETYRIAYVLRHAERESGLGQESQLTEVGVAQALAVGEKLAGGDESFYYASTDFIRTRETCNNIAKGRGETDNVTDTQAELLNGSYFLTVSSDSMDAFAKKKGGGWKIISVYAYDEDYYADQVKLHFYDLFERGNQFVMENVVANMSKWKRVSILVSHDLLLEPLVVYASNREVDVNFYRSGRWVNYLTGVAVVLNADNQVELYPVRGTDIGYMTQKKVVTRTDSTTTVVDPAE